MSESANWDWDSKEKLVANINDLKKKFIDVRELTPSDDGEKIAAGKSLPWSSQNMENLLPV
jgi:hypothetical protein